MRVLIAFLCSGLLLTTLFFACKKLEVVEAVPPSGVETRFFNAINNTNTISGQIIEYGDGIVDYGHIWTIKGPEAEDAFKNPDVLRDAGNIDALPLDTFISELTFPEEGNYSIWAYIVDVHGLAKFGEEKIYSNMTILADFEINIDADNSNCDAPCQVDFENMSSLNAVGFSWYVDGVLQSSSMNYSHVFVKPKSDPYLVKLTAFSASGDSICRTKEVSVNAIAIDKTFSSLYKDGQKIRKLPDGSGYLIAGVTSDSDIYLIRTDEYGDIDGPNGFEQIYPRLPASLNTVNDVIIHSNGANYIIVGTTFNENTGKEDVLYLRTDNVGDKIGNIELLGFADRNNRGMAIIEAADESVLIVGSSIDDTGNSDIFIRKNEINPSNLDFQHFVELPDNEVGRAAVEVSGDFVIVGRVTASGGGADSDGVLIKVDNQGNLLSNYPKNIGTPNDDEVVAIVKKDNSLYLGGTTVMAGNPRFYFIETDLNGNNPLPQIIESNSNLDMLHDLSLLQDGRFLLTGQQNADGFFVIIDEGDAPFSKVNDLGGDQIFYSGIQTNDCEFLFAGHNGGTLRLFKTDEN